MEISGIFLIFPALSFAIRYPFSLTSLLYRVDDIESNSEMIYLHNPSIFSGKSQKKPVSLFNTPKSSFTKDLASRVRRRSAEKKVKRLLNEILAKDMITGYDLRRLRKALGIEVIDFYAISKINVTVLKMIENDQFDGLQADIYLKSFLRSYAEILQIDSQAIIDGYLKNKVLIGKSD